MMFVARIVKIPATGAAYDLSFPNAGMADQLDYTFDFTPWLSALDRVANAVVVPDAAITLGTLRTDGSRVIARLGPASAAGTYFICCAVITSQNRIGSVSVAVTLR